MLGCLTGVRGDPRSWDRLRSRSRPPAAGAGREPVLPELPSSPGRVPLSVCGLRLLQAINGPFMDILRCRVAIGHGSLMFNCPG